MYRSFRHRVHAGLAGVALFIATSVGAAHAQQAATKTSDHAPTDTSSIAARLSGTWHFNQDLSTGASTDVQPDTTGRPSGSGSGNGTGNGGGGFSFGMRGRGGNNAPHGFTQSEQTREVHALTDEVVDTPKTLVIKASASTMDVTPGENDARVFTIRNTKEKVDLGLSKVDVTTHWENGAVVQDFDAGNPMKLSESYAVSLDGKQLTVTLIVTRPKEQGGTAKPITRVYER